MKNEKRVYKIRTLSICFLCLMICLLLTAVGLVGFVYALDTATVPKSVSWTNYIEEKIIPAVIVTVTAIGTIYMAIAPILARVRTASDRFNSATTNVNTVSKKAVESEKKMSELIEIFETRIKHIESLVEHIETITKIGFCNNSELVQNGYAREIAKVGKDEAKN